MLGIDIIDISRFKKFRKKRNDPFLLKVFSSLELDYCFKFNDPSSHLAGMFAAKEAASKALGTQKFLFTELEIRHTKDGAPEVWKKGKKIAVSVSITHTASIAAAVAMM